MAESLKESRQGKRVDKTRFEFLIWTDSYDFLDRQARAERTTMAVILNRLIRKYMESVPRGTFVP